MMTETDNTMNTNLKTQSDLAVQQPPQSPQPKTKGLSRTSNEVQPNDLSSDDELLVNGNSKGSGLVLNRSINSDDNTPDNTNIEKKQTGPLDNNNTNFFQKTPVQASVKQNPPLK
jgi:hypothetical protein